MKEQLKWKNTKEKNHCESRAMMSIEEVKREKIIRKIFII